MRRSQIISLLLAILIGFGALAGVLAAGWTPVLGVQLQGGVEVLLRPTSPADDEQLDRAIEIIRSRVDALGVAEPDITRQGEQVVIQLPGVKDKQRAVDLVGQTAELRFRPVLLTFSPFDEAEFRSAIDFVDAYNGATDAGTQDFEIDPGAVELDLGDLDIEELPDLPETLEPEPSQLEPVEPESPDTEPVEPSSAPDDPGVNDDSPEGQPDDDASAGTGGFESAAFERGDVDLSSTAAVFTGGAMFKSAQSDDSDADQTDDQAPTDEEPEELLEEELPLELDFDDELPLELDFDDGVPALPPTFTLPEDDIADQAVVLPGRGQPIGYVLGPAELTGEAVAEAAATFNNEWVVNVDLTDEGSVGFDAMAARYFGQQIAIVLDGVVESAPAIRATEFGGTAVISGTFAEEEARDLAVALRFGALPVEFEQDDVRTVSATLGEGTLRAGVIAGIVGLILVGLYMLVYYRLLGVVAVASLAISGSILWSLISWLGESRGLALTLAGTTGIIVSIGVQVDSNIIYYERIKEEVRRGRAVRSAADASFKAAFSTIVWADLASLIGAGVLYQLTTGTVRGFALYLGLATLIDLAVSYFFMRPLVVFVARKLVAERPRRLGVSPREPDLPVAVPTGGSL